MNITFDTQNALCIKYGKRKDSRRMRKELNSLPKRSEEGQDKEKKNCGRTRVFCIIVA